ncbi:uncharacterized protein LOC121734257 [Aricia agestis]|uniref:uncharacterized protein LOC121734257 n=1 Tax=Aricia agestis TaxID=91739 RepID=UPI001C20BBC2|nr:uncharacterized protein LOC121734257 [Aricia agestis]
MSDKIKFRDVYDGIQTFRNFLLGRKYTLHNRFLPFISPRSIPRPDIPKSSVVKYSDNYYAQRHVFDSVKPPVIAPVAEALPADQKCGESTEAVCFQSAPTPGRVWWWDGHSYYEDEKKAIQRKEEPKLEGPK